MFLRLPLLLVCLLSLALGPVQLSAACMLPVMDGASCGTCCPESEKACCEAVDAAVPVKAPLAAPTAVDDGKLLASPVFVVVKIHPLPVVEHAVYGEWEMVRLPVTPRLEVTCIRLI